MSKLMPKISYRGDIFGGITTAVVAMPLALAFGVSSGAGALTGLYGAIFAGALAAIFGGTRVQITGPTGPMTVVMALIVAHFSGNLAAAFAVVILAGVFQVIFGKIGIGGYIKLVPQPVVSGFMGGIGVIIIILQIPPLLGQVGPDGSILDSLLGTPELFDAINYNALMLGLLTLAVMIFTPRFIARLVPPPLIALIIGLGVSLMFSLSVPVIGEVPTGIPSFTMPDISIDELPFIIRFALVLAFLGAIDSLLTSLVADSITRSSHNSNKELVGQGIGNIVAGFFGGLPSAGATMRTLVNVRAGGNSPLSGVIHSVLLLAIVLGFGESVSYIPLAVLGGILVKVGIDIIDWNYLKRLHRVPKAGVVIMLSTLLLTVLVDLISAFAIGFIMASVLFVSRMADAQLKSAKFLFHDNKSLSPQEANILKQHQGRIALFHVEGPLSFGSARAVAQLLQANLNDNVLLFDLSDVPFIDTSAATALDEVVDQIHEADGSMLMFGARDNVKKVLQQTDLLAKIGEDRLFNNRIEALEMAQSIIQASAIRIDAGDKS